MKMLLSAALLFSLISCGTSSSKTAAQESGNDSDATVAIVMQAEQMLLQEGRSKAAVKDDLDADDDGDLSKDELKAGLDNLGQKIKAAIQAKHEEIKAAQDAAKEKIKDACVDQRGSEECRAVAQEEREKLKDLRQTSLEDLQKELETLKDMLVTVESESVTLS